VVAKTLFRERELVDEGAGIEDAEAGRRVLDR